MPCIPSASTSMFRTAWDGPQVRIDNENEKSLGVDDSTRMMSHYVQGSQNTDRLIAFLESMQ
jgi:hypothetical protein